MYLRLSKNDFKSLKTIVAVRITSCHLIHTTCKVIVALVFKSNNSMAQTIHVRLVYDSILMINIYKIKYALPLIDDLLSDREFTGNSFIFKEAGWLNHQIYLLFHDMICLTINY